MSASVLVFLPILSACCLAAIVDLGLRLHGGLDTPTPVTDAIVALVRQVRS